MSADISVSDNATSYSVGNENMNDSINNEQDYSPSLVLASQSPRRKELLAQLGYEFSIQAADIDESMLEGETASEYVLRLAKQKAQHVLNNLTKDKKNTYVLGSDTSVVFNDKVLGKPENKADCLNTLSLLSGNQHQVLTSIALASDKGVIAEVIKTEVSFKTLSEQEINGYWLTGEPQDKAGSYGIQGIAAQFVKQISGSYSAVVGLPLYETAKLLSAAGIAGAINSTHIE